MILPEAHIHCSSLTRWSHTLPSRPTVCDFLTKGCSRMPLYNGKFWPNHMIGHRCGTSCKPQRAVLHRLLCQLRLSPWSMCAIILLSPLLLFHIYRNPEDLLMHNILAGSSLRTLVFWCPIRCYCCIISDKKKYFPFGGFYQMFIFEKNLFFIWKCKESAEGGKGRGLRWQQMNGFVCEPVKTAAGFVLGTNIITTHTHAHQHPDWAK